MARIRRTDDQTAERLLAGQLDPQDAPPALSGVATLFASAAVPADPADPDEALLTAMSVAALSAEAPNRRKQMLSKSRSAKIGAVAFGGLVLLGGTAAAGELPDPLQDAAADVADVVGVDLPEGSNGLAEEVHEIKDEFGPGERGAEVSKAAHARNEARKAAREDAETEAEDDDTDEDKVRGKSADAHENKPADADADKDEGDVETDEASTDNEGADNAEMQGGNADEAPPALPEAANPAEQAEPGLDHRPAPAP